MTAFAELTKAGGAAEFSAENRSQIAGGTLAARLMPGCRDVGGGAGGAAGWGASQSWEPWLAVPGWMDVASACLCRLWDLGSLTSRLAPHSDRGGRRW